MECNEDIIELGTAKIETKGPLGQGVDENKQIPVAGLSED